MGFGKEGRGQMIRENELITLAALPNQTAIKGTSPLVLTEDFRITAIDLESLHLSGMTGNEGPVGFGIASNELSVAEIAAAINMNGPKDPDDRSFVEQIERAVKVFGTVRANGVWEPSGNGNFSRVNRLKHQWTYSSTNGWCWFAFNFSNNTLTTGGVIQIHCKIYGVWIR